MAFDTRRRERGYGFLILLLLSPLLPSTTTTTLSPSSRVVRQMLLNPTIHLNVGSGDSMVNLMAGKSPASFKSKTETLLAPSGFLNVM